MKTFKDLQFKKHPLGGNRIQAKISFTDGSEISIIQGDGCYGGSTLFEMMSNRTNTKDGIRGWMTEDQITRHLRYIQKNPLKK